MSSPMTALASELIAGILIGPGMLAWAHPSETLSTVSTMGVIVLMFAVGLETRPSELFKVGVPRSGRRQRRHHLAVGRGLLLRDGPRARNARVDLHRYGARCHIGRNHCTRLADRGFLSTTEARIILAAAVIDDVLGMLVLSFAIGSAKGAVNLTQIAVLVLQVVLFIGFELWLAPIIVKKHGHWLDRLKIPNAGFVVALVVMLAMAALSELIGLAGIVGAFFAGMMFAETEDRWSSRARSSRSTSGSCRTSSS